tara:strand:+ start:188 stop:355 length:168 start_codon:yes stop_codon:yes gene_type:complete
MFKRKRIRTIEAVPENLKDFFKNSVVNYYDSLVLKNTMKRVRQLMNLLKARVHHS